MKWAIGPLAFLLLCIVTDGQEEYGSLFQNGFCEHFIRNNTDAGILKLIDTPVNFIGTLCSTIKCVVDILKKFDLCNFNTTVDPFVYVKTCANNTGFKRLTDALVEKIRPVTINAGVPAREEHSRCFNKAYFFQSLLPSLIPSSTLLPIPKLSTKIPMINPFG